VRLERLTNGSATVTSAFVDRAGLADYIEQVISAEATGSWKPPAQVYQQAAAALGVKPTELAPVAAHAWDCHGAKRAGLVTGWVSRLEREYSPEALRRHRAAPPA
jgi:2-haloacid dehalogenase